MSFAVEMTKTNVHLHFCILVITDCDVMVVWVYLWATRVQTHLLHDEETDIDKVRLSAPNKEGINWGGHVGSAVIS